MSTGGQTETVLQGLSPDTPYQVKVNSIKGGKRSTDGPSQPFKTLPKGKRVLVSNPSDRKCPVLYLMCFTVSRINLDSSH